MGEHLVVPRLLGVDDLAAERKHGLGPAIPALLGRAPGRVALHEEELPKGWLALRAVGQLAREGLVVGPPLAGELPGLTCRLPRLGRPDALLDDPARGRRILFEGHRQFLVHDGLDPPLDVAVAQLGLRLPLELGLGQADRDDGRESLADILAAY